MIETKHAKSLGELSRGDAVEHPTITRETARLSAWTLCAR